ncbi:MAG: hypothetical protein Q9162_000173 [Coniocarpon cinnabarinum]
MDDTVIALAGRSWLREMLSDHANGNITTQATSQFQANLANSLTGTQQQALAMQAAIWPARAENNTSLSPLLNATSSDAESPHILFPAVGENGSTIWLGAPEGGLPEMLYPNLTQSARPDRGNVTSYNGKELTPESTIFLGPLWTNETSVLFSITRAVMDTTNTSIAGWLTVVLDGRLVLQISQNPIAIGESGLNLIVGPNTNDNKFANGSQDQPYYTQGPEILDQPVHFVLPPARDSGHPYEVQRPQASKNVTYPWQLNAYPAAQMAFTTPWSDLQQGGSHLQDRNENGASVGVGYASPQSQLCDWVVMIEYTSKEVYSPIAQLRRVILISFGVTVAVLIVTVVPITGIWAGPVRRLRAATAESIAHYSDTESLCEKGLAGTSGYTSGCESQALQRRPTKVSVGSKPSWRGSLFSSNGKGEQSASEPPKRLDIHKLTGARSQFRIPPRVKERKLLSCIQDELSELTTVFNQMSDELSFQYSTLEERVLERTKELQDSKKAAEAANESKTLFIANISHELKTPLNGILGMTAVCMQEEDSKLIKDSLNVIYHSGDLLHNLLTDLLDFSKNEAGHPLALKEKRFRLKDIDYQISAVFGNQAKTNGVALSISYEGPTPRSTSEGRVLFADESESLSDLCLIGDRSRILQVVINLVSNALKFTPKDGNVWLRMRKLQPTAPKLNDPWKPSTSSANQMSSLSSIPDTSNSHSSDMDDRSAILKQRSKYAASTSPDNTHMTAGGEREDASPDLPSYHFEFEVQDTGPGIAADVQQKIFEPFVQGDVSLARKHGGTGLGLSICRQLAKLLHGSIGVESKPGQGSTFRLRIPLRISPYNRTSADSDASTSSRASSPGLPPVQEHVAEERMATALQVTSRSASVVSQSSKPRLLGLSQPFFSTSQTPVASPTSESMPGTPKMKQALRVLVAEDNETNRRVIVRLLELEDIANITVAKDGEEAFEKVKERLAGQEQFDLILMDVQMPKMDGRQSTKRIREAGFTAPIVALTAFTDELNQKECFEAGMDSFIGKPIKKPELKKMLRKLSSNDKDSFIGSTHSQNSPSVSEVSQRKFSYVSNSSTEKPNV